MLWKLGIKPWSRWVFSPDKEYCISEPAREDKTIGSSKTNSIHQSLTECFDSPSQLADDNIYRTDIQDTNIISLLAVRDMR